MMTDNIKRVLISEEEISAKVCELADKINTEFADKNPIVISILKGAFIFMSDLTKKIKIPMTIDFMAVSSYGSGVKSTGEVNIIKDINQDISGKHIIIVEDILDSGHTLNCVINILKKRNPASIVLYTLLDKPERRVVDIKADYACFTVPDEFVVGYGLDYGEYYRNLPYIGVLKPEVYGGR